MPSTRGTRRECSVPSCARPAGTKGLCGMHYQRYLRHGDVGEASPQQAVSYAGMTCKVHGCDRTPKAQELCLSHYKRLTRWGDPLGEPPIKQADTRFQRYVRVGSAPATRPGLGACFLWTGGRVSTGYGMFHPAGEQSVLAHRWAYAAAKGAIPDGMVIDHLCRNRICVNPAHLEAVTNEENLRRGAGFALQNGMRDHCINGHKYDLTNTYTAPDGGIRCRACNRARDARRSPRRNREKGIA